MRRQVATVLQLLRQYTVFVLVLAVVAEGVLLVRAAQEIAELKGIVVGTVDAPKKRPSTRHSRSRGLRGEVDRLRSDIEELRVDVQAEIDELRGEIDSLR